MTSQDIFVVGFTDGTVRVYKYPVLYDRAEYLEFSAHQGPVGSICITVENENVVTCGSDDSTIVVWRLNPVGFEEAYSENY